MWRLADFRGYTQRLEENNNKSYDRGTYKSWLAGRAVRLSSCPTVRLSGCPFVRSVCNELLCCAALAKYLLDLLFDFYVRINAVIWRRRRRLQTMPTAVESGSDTVSSLVRAWTSFFFFFLESFDLGAPHCTFMLINKKLLSGCDYASQRTTPRFG